MQKRITYICDLCGWEYDTEEKCRKCENGHRRLEELTLTGKYAPINDYQDGFPERIIAESNETKVLYKRYFSWIDDLDDEEGEEE